MQRLQKSEFRHEKEENQPERGQLHDGRRAVQLLSRHWIVLQCELEEVHEGGELVQVRHVRNPARARVNKCP